MPSYDSAYNWIFRSLSECGGLASRGGAAAKVNRGRLVDGVVVKDIKHFLLEKLPLVFEIMARNEEWESILKLACVASVFSCKAKEHINYRNA